MGKLKFCEKLVHLQRQPINFDGRPYLLERLQRHRSESGAPLQPADREEHLFGEHHPVRGVYQARHPDAVRVPPHRAGRVFTDARLLPSLEESPLIRRTLLGRRSRRLKVTNMQFANGSTLFVRAAYHSADACRGISSSLLMVDEFQDMAAGDLPVLQETLSHARRPHGLNRHAERRFEPLGNGLFPIHGQRVDHTLWQVQQGRDPGRAEPRPGGIICPNCRIRLTRETAVGSHAIPMPAGVPGFGSTIRWFPG